MSQSSTLSLPASPLTANPSPNTALSDTTTVHPSISSIYQDAQVNPSTSTVRHVLSPSATGKPILKTLTDNKNTQEPLAQTGDAGPLMENNPFAFTPALLSKLIGPKNLDVLREMGGIDGLIYGLRTSVENGLSSEEQRFRGNLTLDKVLEAVREKERTTSFLSTRDLDELKEFETADPDHSEPQTSENKHYGVDIFSPISKTFTFRTQTTSIPFEDRRRIFSWNKITPRPPKNILQLMWAALHDRILVET
jgi:hypothetical protein